MTQIFNSVFDTATQVKINLTDFLICIGTALLIGVFLAAVYTVKTNYTKSFVITLATLPAVVCVVIMAVNGNVGAGVAVAGAFSLVRFRSAPGSARDIGTIFLAMGAGLMCGMGFIAYALLFAVIMGIALMVFTLIGSKASSEARTRRTLRITIPEDLDYTEIFDDLFEKYTKENELVSVKTVNMGSLFRIVYNITLKDTSQEKKFIDELRCRNGNLEISIARQEMNAVEL